MSTERQIYSIDNQRDAIRNYAEVMGYDIVATYEDPGRSGLSILGRPGLKRLIEDIESRRADFETVVVYDVSRWGRFQNTDESASYEYRCQRAGVRIEFCAELFVNDGSIGSDVLKAIKRSMAAEYSRMLSNRVFAGQSRIVKLGFSGGGPAGYGLRRLLVDGSGNPKAILHRDERKGLASDRVVLVPGPENEVSTVRWIFNQFVKKGKTAVEIASGHRVWPALDRSVRRHDTGQREICRQHCMEPNIPQASAKPAEKSAKRSCSRRQRHRTARNPGAVRSCASYQAGAHLPQTR